jgi:hypothetical protein
MDRITNLRLMFAIYIFFEFFISAEFRKKFGQSLLLKKLLKKFRSGMPEMKSFHLYK